MYYQKSYSIVVIKFILYSGLVYSNQYMKKL